MHRTTPAGAQNLLTGLSAAIAFAILSCAEPEPGTPKDTTRIDSSRAAAHPKEAFIGGTTMPTDGHTLLDTASFDFDGDGALERIELAATVELDSRGRPLWEDGHRWRVLARDDSAAYALFDEFVPWGGVAFWAIAESPSEARAIVVQSTSLAGGNGAIAVRKFVFDRERRGFTRVASVDASGSALYRAPHGISTLLPRSPQPGAPRE